MDDFTAITAAAVSGLDIAWMPDWLAAQEVEQGRLRYILPQSAGVTFPIAAVWPEARGWRRKFGSPSMRCSPDCRRRSARPEASNKTSHLFAAGLSVT
ncbi:TPA: LysR substrate-binding domain-containing protein [Raoultella planticola]|uniref:LysR substrate-binding domain-containing protein n=1 Tax=Raoultella planticola TaxID=575 RepID=UPI00211E79FE|nr:LysR substrate-binding domain-containing protein [Raoultella planticola]